MARKFNYKGMTNEQVKAMSLDDFIKTIPSKPRRTLKRMGMQIKKFLEKYRDDKKKGKVHKTHFREMVVIPEMLDTTVLVYDGKSYVTVVCTAEMLGHRLGEYAITTKLVKHSGPGIGATRGSKTVELK